MIRTQICNVCGVEKEITQFEHLKNRPNPRKTCRECRYKQRDREKEKEKHREYMKRRREQEPHILRQNWERSKYGVCKEDIGVTSCMICGSTDRLCIDHCHSTLKVRGILCTKCNAAIGMFDDNIKRMENAIQYLIDGPHFQLK